MEKESGSNRLLNTQNSPLVRISKSLKVSNKLLYKGVDKLFNEAFYLMNSKHFPKISEDIYSIIEIDPFYIPKKCFRFQADNVEDYEKAILLFTEILKIDPTNKHAYCFRGLAKYKIFDSPLLKVVYGKPHLSESYSKHFLDYDQALNIDAEYTFAKFLKAAYECQIPNLKDLETVVEVVADFPQAYLEIGYTLQFEWWHHINAEQGFIGNLNGTVDLSRLNNYNKAITINSSFPEAYYKRGTYYQNETPDRQLLALNDYNKAIQLDSQYEDAYYKRGMLNMDLMNYQEAIDDFSFCLKNSERQDRFKYYYARHTTFLQIGNIEAAFADLNNYYLIQVTDKVKFSNESSELVLREFFQRHSGREFFNEKVFSDYGLTKDSVVNYENVFDYLNFRIMNGDLLSINHRGVCKYRLKDVEGAVKDFNELKDYEHDDNFADFYLEEIKDGYHI